MPPPHLSSLPKSSHSPRCYNTGLQAIAARGKGPSGHMTFGVIVGNRGFFPDHLAKSGREQIVTALQNAGHQAICLTPEQTKHGAVETRAEAKACADLFRTNRDKIDGIIVTLPNFGDERGIAEALR